LEGEGNVTTITDPIKDWLNVLIIDDETNIRKTLTYCLEAEGHRVVSVSNSSDAVYEARRRSFDIVFLDLKLGKEDGMDLIPVLLADSSWLKIIIITAFASIESVVEAMKRGASDYIVKPFTTDQVKIITRRVAKVRQLENQVASLKDNVERFGGEDDPFLSKNIGMQRFIETAKKVAPTEAIVLLRGESGTGKSVFARAIHNWSNRSPKPMAVVACPAVPHDLLESEIFGHVKGAFTGAIKENPGRIASCEGGTLFLDEIGEMPFSIQAKLLRFIQDKEYERLGDSTLRKADVRIIAATNSDLEKQVSEGIFREDLFYRLNVINLIVPPLRDRPEDIMPLATSFLAYFCRVNHKTIQSFSDSAVEKLTGYKWPGNVRELRNTIERAVILGSGNGISSKDLPENILPVPTEPVIGDMIPLSVVEELHIRRIMAKTSSLQEAAEVLGIDQATLWRRRKAYGI
jgi:two-component system, NtrC family, response regulator AlgB